MVTQARINLRRGLASFPAPTESELRSPERGNRSIAFCALQDQRNRTGPRLRMGEEIIRIRGQARRTAPQPAEHVHGSEWRFRRNVSRMRLLEGGRHGPE